MDNNDSKGIKYDNEKIKWNLLPIEVMRDVVKILMFGAKKYKPNNWKYVEPWDIRYYNAAKRHLNDWWLGEKNDDETGLNHLAHAICCLIFLLWDDKHKERTFIGD